MPIISHLKLDAAMGQISNAASFAIRMMMEDTHTLANPITPYKHNALRTSVSKQMETPLKGVMKWNVPYAQYQERGMRADGTRVVRNYTTPGTHAHFVEESVQKVVKKIPQYIRAGGLV